MSVTTLAPSRTLVLPASPSFGWTLPISMSKARPDGQWPTAKPSDNLDYYLDASAPLSEAGDVLSSVMVDIMPSGSGELVASKPGTVGGVISIWLTGGVPSRAYLVRFIAAGESGRAWEWLIGLSIDVALAAYPVPKPPQPGFGSSVTWSVPEYFSFDFSIPENSWLAPHV